MVIRGRRWIGVVLSLVACGDDSQPAMQDTGGGSTTGDGPSSTSSSDGDPSGTTAVADSSTSLPGTTTAADDSTGDGTTGSGSADPGCPECIVLADDLANGRGIAVDATHVYFTDQSAGTISRVPIAGGDVETIAMSQAAPYDIAVDGEAVYWTNFDAAGSVQRIAKDGDTPELVDTNTPFPRAIALDATHVYWTGFTANSGALARRPLTLDGSAQTLLTGDAGFAELAVGPDSVYVSSHDPTTGGVGFIEPPPEKMQGAILSVPLDGIDEPDTLAVVSQPWGIALTDDGTVVWATGDGAAADGPLRIFRYVLAAPPEEQLTTAQMAPWGVATDGERVYFTDHAEVKAVPTAGGDIVVLATMQNSARSIAVTSDSVYWITQERVLGRPKP
jgi:hypothetical protein